jgi:hypothetical protein
MKKDLLAVAALVVIAMLGAGVFVWWQVGQADDRELKVVKPKSEPIALLPKKEPPKKVVDAPPKEPVRVPKKKQVEKIEEPAPKKIIEDKPPAKVEPEPKKNDKPPPPEKKVEPKAEPKVEVNAEPKKQPAKMIAIGNDIKLNDPDGEFVVQSIQKGQTVTLQGTIKRLKIADQFNRSTLDATLLTAEEIVVMGNVNSNAKVLLGKASKLTYRDVNGPGSLLDASMLGAKEIRQTGNLNSGAAVKLHAPGGTVILGGQVNNRVQLTIDAADGKVIAESNMNASANVKITAKDVDLRADIHGGMTVLDITLTKDGSLKFKSLGSGVQLHYRKAEMNDPAPRISRGMINARATFREIGGGK